MDVLIAMTTEFFLRRLSVPSPVCVAMLALAANTRQTKLPNAFSYFANIWRHEDSTTQTRHYSG